jgi:hypothetical protein
MSSLTGTLIMSPVNSHVVFLASMPDVPSNTYIIKISADLNQSISFDYFILFGFYSLYLNDRLAAGHLQHLARSDRIVGQRERNNFGKFWKFNVVQYD